MIRPWVVYTLRTWARGAVVTTAARIDRRGAALQAAIGEVERAAALFGRGRELAATLALLGAGDDGTLSAVELVGPPGIGKTAIWREALARLADDGRRVLSCAPSAAEVRLSFGALGDLLAPLGRRELDVLPSPQRRALEVALLEADGPPVDARAVAVALLAALRMLAHAQPLVIALDDLQWLDGASASALGFALRRLDSDPVAVLATRRTGRPERRPVELEQLLGHDRVRQVDLGPLTLGAIHELLAARLGVTVSRRTLIALHEAAAGNPLLSIELARELQRRGLEPGPGVPLPIPARIRTLVTSRLSQLPDEVNGLLLAAAALSRPTVELLTRLQPDAELCLLHAADGAVVEILDDGVLRFAHPLLAQIPYEALRPAQRRRLHAELARIVDDHEERARHRALAAPRPNAAVAAELERVAAAAGRRGALQSAADLSLLAARLTSPSRLDRRAARMLSAAEWQHRDGELERAAALADALLEMSGADAEARARALALLGTIRADTEGVSAALSLYRRAAREPGVSKATRAEIHRRRAWLSLGAGEARAAARHGRAALRLATGEDPASEAGASAVAVLTATVRGEPVRRDVLARACELEQAADEVRAGDWLETAPSVVEGVALLWAGDLEDARAPLERVRARAHEREDAWLEMHSLAYLSALLTGLGELRHGMELAEEYLVLATAANQEPQRAGALWPVANAAAWLGDEQRARSAAGEGLAMATDSGHMLYAIGCQAALGMVELSSGRGAEAAALLEAALQQARRSGIESLGRVPLLPDLIEALASIGEVGHAGGLASELDQRARRLNAPWALAVAHRSHAIVAAATGDTETAVAALERALAEHARQPRAPELARTELVLGTVMRRTGGKRAAREVLERAAGTFEAIEARAWASRARRELARIGGRAGPAAGELSATEAAIAELVRVGRTNREIAATLHLSPRTIEWNLSRVYRKLGVRSRTELAARLAHPPASGQ